MAHEVLKHLIVLVIDITEIKNSFLKNNFHASLAFGQERHISLIIKIICKTLQKASSLCET